MAKKIMYLIQRKSDGKYFRNRDFKGYYSDKYGKVEDAGWTKHKSECKPFKTVNGAKQSRGWVSKKFIRSDEQCPLCQKGVEHSEDYYKHWKCVERTEEELPYRIVEVKVSIE